eukprot:CAMPEP_0172191364 /NCGR_PEP_ID=MMETSP1050-20130122/23656_1 /TAXON_ID=233186 /ORGANISM="Cryptomonas curvata, Strain CCAP979/52" /LENGTH=61 /DNA_ID=CAMNT_0012866397 /DNA_START=89 /DNA_END=270 /DNA_ORIENTATION=-
MKDRKAAMPTRILAILAFFVGGTLLPVVFDNIVSTSSPVQRQAPSIPPAFVDSAIHEASPA